MAMFFYGLKYVLQHKYGRFYKNHFEFLEIIYNFAQSFRQNNTYSIINNLFTYETFHFNDAAYCSFIRFLY